MARTLSDSLRHPFHPIEFAFLGLFDNSGGREAGGGRGRGRWSCISHSSAQSAGHAAKASLIKNYAGRKFMPRRRFSCSASPGVTYLERGGERGAASPAKPLPLPYSCNIHCQNVPRCRVCFSQCQKSLTFMLSKLSYLLDFVSSFLLNFRFI